MFEAGNGQGGLGWLGRSGRGIWAMMGGVLILGLGGGHVGMIAVSEWGIDSRMRLPSRCRCICVVELRPPSHMTHLV